MELRVINSLKKNERHLRMLETLVRTKWRKMLRERRNKSTKTPRRQKRMVSGVYWS